MSQFGNIFNSIASAKPLSNHTPRLPLGRHKVALKRYQPKNSEQGMGPILESDFVILESNSPSCRPGDVRGWPWFIGQSGWGGTYEQGRAKDFLEKAAMCIDDTRPVEQFGDDLASAHQPGTGLVLWAEITLQYDREGKPKKDKKQRDCFNASWEPIKQSIAELQAMAAQLATMPALVPNPTHPNAPGSGYAGHGGSGMGQFVGQQPAQGGFGQPAQPQAQQQPAQGFGQSAQPAAPAQGGGFGGGLQGFRRP